ncbi:chromate transporter [Ramlibacter sp. AW1]|uniref:Chromate transporter n=1 Tax=Ramlibacter aurantiacus TaxID=2801330 RepID=A0A936ZR37_9BURK|nr:chromate transporter [Ramlibacter aurantiacus]
MTAAFTVADWLAFFGHFLALSLLAVGGAISTVPDMHRYLVERQRWLTDAEFTAAIAIAQAAPGPNVLFVGLLGWNVGLQAGGGLPGAAMGLVLALTGILLPSTTLTYAAASWGQRNRDRRAVRAFKQGMAPIVVALLVATGWLLATGGRYDLQRWPVWLLSLATTIIVWRTRLHLLWLLAAGGLLGWFGWV